MDGILDNLTQLISALQSANENLNMALGELDTIRKNSEKPLITDKAFDDDLELLSEIIVTADVAEILDMTTSNVSRLFQKGELTPYRQLGKVWITTRSAVQRYQENRVERRGNPWFGTIHKGRKPKSVEAAQDTLSAHEETANEFAGHETE